MRTVNKHPAWENQPLRLTDEERKNPYIVVEEFYTCFHLQDMREILWEWLVAALSSESINYNTAYSRSNLIFVYEKLESFMEATYVLNKRRNKKKKRNRQEGKPWDNPSDNLNGLL